ncbi:zinc metalloprotease [Legionella birminghamensis]|uniref:Metal-dependent hydrolase n=1 Tax=Legionella birminghamensis TaxID=28083 RepID=A0A378IE04_9GAMM|nr:SprT family zinc-dependent metalloprotease [Legionella birminghamensis]KTC66840.1 zinc metalloprotease [Legionella birminghamensis]STX32965.1 metal-dependent hydrolase [Legionella birminghamensis]
MVQQIITKELLVTIIRKPIKHLYLKITAPHGDIVVSAPLQMANSSIEQFIESRRAWIVEKHRQVKEHRQPHPLPADQIKYLGKTYFLGLQDQESNQIHGLNDKTLHYSLQPGNTIDRLLNSWYRQELTNHIKILLEKWQPLIKVFPNYFDIRSMKSRWGSCNTKTGRICLNLQLIHHPFECIEYVFVHEMVHLLEASHNHRFKRFMTQFLPDWQERRRLLNGK